ncbi:hypothetical protein N0V83_010390 [Neocucurbitaria cava]|uniref:Protein kinase domain-containing protein n=1 Tax=Neocucurbitaria cava TaxID=798079 RepID=A0A9W8XXF7_9PLEO|nr:hypothetical protein N0V83_010390 [Neocucurbitaria cava]
MNEGYSGLSQASGGDRSPQGMLPRPPMSFQAAPDIFNEQNPQKKRPRPVSPGIPALDVRPRQIGFLNPSDIEGHQLPTNQYGKWLPSKRGGNTHKALAKDQQLENNGFQFYTPTPPLFEPSPAIDATVTENSSPSSHFKGIDEILSEVGLADAKPLFDSHGVSDFWLPLPKHILRHLFTSSQDEKLFFNAQLENLKTTLTAWDDLISRPSKEHVHTAFEDGEDTLLERRILGEGGVGTVEEISILTDSGSSLTCVRKKITRPRQLKAHKQVMAAFVREINVMRQVDHHHCVRLLGSYTDLDSVNILLNPVADMDLAMFLDHPLVYVQKKSLYKWMHCLCEAL